MDFLISISPVLAFFFNDGDANDDDYYYYESFQVCVLHAMFWQEAL